MPISLNQENGPGYAINSIVSAAPLVLFSGATYSIRHFLLASNDKAHRYSHIALGILQLIPVIGGLAAFADWIYNKKIQVELRESLFENRSVYSTLKNTSLEKESTPFPGSSENKKYLLNIFPNYYRDQPGNIFLYRLEKLYQEDPINLSQEEIEYLIKNYKAESTINFSTDFDERAALIVSNFQTLAQIKDSTICKESNQFNLIVQNSMTVKVFVDRHYPENEGDSTKFRERMGWIESYFDKHTIYPVKGNGDCFFNALIPGLLLKANEESAFRFLLVKKVEEFSSRKEATSPVSKKENSDLQIVINFLKNDPPYNFFDQKFNEVFSRVLRDMSVLQNQSRTDHRLSDDDIPNTFGGEKAHVDVTAIGLINEIFTINAYCAILQTPLFLDKNNDVLNISDQTSSKAEEVFITRGEVEYENTNCSEKFSFDRKGKKVDFVLILANGHFSCLT